MGKGKNNSDVLEKMPNISADLLKSQENFRNSFIIAENAIETKSLTGSSEDELRWSFAGLHSEEINKLELPNLKGLTKFVMSINDDGFNDSEICGEDPLALSRDNILLLSDSFHK